MEEVREFQIYIMSVQLHPDRLTMPPELALTIGERGRSFVAGHAQICERAAITKTYLLIKIRMQVVNFT